MAKPKSTPRSSSRAMFSFDMYTGAEKMTIRDLQQRERPSTIKDAQKTARYWQEACWFVETVQMLKSGFLNFGMRLVPKLPRAERLAGKARTQTKEQAKIDKWLEAKTGKVINGDMVDRYIEDVINEDTLQDNVVSFWRDGQFPSLLKVEHCDYTNAFGNERLRTTLGLSPESLKGLGLSAEKVRRYSQEEIWLDEEEDEFFRVATRQYQYHGFCYPRLRRVFTALSQLESQEVGEGQLAHMGRLVLRFHRFGFEVKSTASAFKQSDFLWSKTRSDALIKFLRGRQGAADITGQFDHTIDYIWPDPKLYDAKKWESVIQRLIWWAGPLGFIILAQQMPDHLLKLFAVECGATRLRVGRHIEDVLNSCGVLPGGMKVAVEWGNQCFEDPQLAWKMTQGLMQQGALSLTSALEGAGYNPRVEIERKAQEAKEPKEHMLPLYDGAHGNRPGEAPGRPKSSKDGSGK